MAKLTHSSIFLYIHENGPVYELIINQPNIPDSWDAYALEHRYKTCTLVRDLGAVGKTMRRVRVQFKSK